VVLVYTRTEQPGNLVEADRWWVLLNGHPDADVVLGAGYDSGKTRTC
jgi:hypothetical protein